MSLMSVLRLLLLVALAFNTTGCGTIVAHSMAFAPNRFPDWLAPSAPVTLAFNPKLLTNFPAQYVDAGPPPARLCYRVVEPADYSLKITSTNWLEHQKKQFEFHFKATVPGRTNVWTSNPRGTVVLLHGYGLAQFSMLPWALLLAQNGWQCVLVDLRGHGKSTGKRVYYGIKEADDMSRLLDALARDKQLDPPVAMVGESYGAALALRCETTDPRIHEVVAIAPYASLSNATLNICHNYAGWIPKWVIKAGLKKLPAVLQVPADDFDTTAVMKRKPVKALFVAGGDDTINPVEAVEQLRSLALPGSKIIIVPGATHEALTYYFSDLEPPVLSWLGQ